MKKVINVTLGEMVFAIEQDAYDVLASYLDEIKQQLPLNDDNAEVVADIERAIAEKLIVRHRSEKNAVTNADLDIIIAEIGRPVDFNEESTAEKVEPAVAEAEKAEAQSGVKKRLYRNTDEVVIAGVASGLAQYFEIDVVIVRVGFVFAIFFNGLGILAYIILWLVVPAATTTTQKFAMRGEKVTLSHITEQVKKKLDDVDTEQIKSGAKNTWNGVRLVLTKLFSFLGIVVRALVKVFRYIFGFMFVITGAVGISGLVFALSTLWMSENRIMEPMFVQVREALLADIIGYLFILSTFLFMFIPLLISIIIGSSLLSGRNIFTMSKSLTLGVLFVVALALMSICGALYVPTIKEIHQQNFPEQASAQGVVHEISWKLR